jgi:chromosome segregation ATPase
VELEARYGADRRFTAQERTELNQRYQGLTQVVAEGGYAGGVSGGSSVADGRRDFEARVDEAVRIRRLTRTQGTQLKTEYSALVQTETNYMRDGVLSVRERDDLETRLDALDARVGDTNVAATRPADAASRLDAIAKALPASGLASAAQTQLRIEHEDLNRLAAAYRRTSPSTDDQAYLDRRLSNLEERVRLRR